MRTGGNATFGRLFGLLAIASAMLLPQAAARAGNLNDLQSAFDSSVGAQPPATPSAPAPRFVRGTFADEVSALANSEQGRIGVAAVDLTSNRTFSVLGEQPFPMASTVKVAIVATFLEGVDQGRFHLTDRFPLMVPVASRKFDGPVAPVRAGQQMSAIDLIEIAITHSNNEAADALLAAVGGPQAVNGWLRRAGIAGVRIDRDIATLVRDDGATNPARTIDLRDSATPMAMVRLLTGLYQGQWLSPASRNVLLGAMGRCETGRHRIRALLPENALVAHKTGTLSNTASDVGIIQTPDGRTIALAIYVTGQGGKQYRDARIANIARAIYQAYESDAPSPLRAASR